LITETSPLTHGIKKCDITFNGEKGLTLKKLEKPIIDAHSFLFWFRIIS
jgi:hypothetical protein